VSPGATSNGTSIALVRGQNDLIVFKISLVGSGYQLDLDAESQTLGTGSPLRGKGNIAFDPADVSRALLGGTSAGGSNVLTLIGGLPTSITTIGSGLTLPPGANIHSIEIASNGQFAIVGTDLGIFVVNGVNGSTLSLVTPFAPSAASAQANAIPYTNCNGAPSKLTTVYSVGLSLGSLPGVPLDDYLVALGSGSGVSCPSGRNATLVAIPFDPSTGSTPAPTATPTATASSTSAPSPTPPAVFVQNNMIAPPTGADLLIVR